MRLKIGLPEIVAIGLVAALFVVLLAQVVLRPFGLGFVWAEEFAAFAFIVLVFFGTAVAHRRGEHMVVEAFEEWAAPKLSAQQRLIWSIGIELLELAFMTLLAIGLSQMVVQTWNQFAGSLSGFRYGWLFAAVLAAALMSIAALAARLFGKLRSLRDGDAR